MGREVRGLTTGLCQEGRPVFCQHYITSKEHEGLDEPFMVIETRVIWQEFLRPEN